MIDRLMKIVAIKCCSYVIDIML